jgi:uncharacterized RDD family membrane protein YckC
VLDVAYHFAYEAHNGQTIGKRQYGLRVVAAESGPADARATALGSVLRIIDALPTWYVSGLVEGGGLRHDERSETALRPPA